MRFGSPTSACSGDTDGELDGEAMIACMNHEPTPLFDWRPRRRGFSRLAGWTFTRSIEDARNGRRTLVT